MPFREGVFLGQAKPTRDFLLDDLRSSLSAVHPRDEGHILRDIVGDVS